MMMMMMMMMHSQVRNIVGGSDYDVLLTFMWRD